MHGQITQSGMHDQTVKKNVRDNMHDSKATQQAMTDHHNSIKR